MVRVTPKCDCGKPAKQNINGEWQCDGCAKRDREWLFGRR